MFENLSSAPFAEALAADSNGVLLDVRTPAEYAEGHLPNSKLMDIMNASFQGDILDLDPDKNYYVYCRSGGRSSQACMILSSAGIGKKLVNLQGGIMGWQGDVIR